MNWERIYKGVVSLPSFAIELNYDLELMWAIPFLLSWIPEALFLKGIKVNI